MEAFPKQRVAGGPSVVAQSSSTSRLPQGGEQLDREAQGAVGKGHPAGPL